jgi:hypothetical protein
MSVKIVLREEVFIQGLPDSLVEFFCKENTFDNPKRIQMLKMFAKYLEKDGADAIENAKAKAEFIKKQRNIKWMLKHTAETISLWRRSGEWIALPRGYLRDTLAKLAEFGVEFEVEDRSVFPPLGIPALTSGQLYDYQWKALNDLIANACGTMEAPTGCVTGNTIIHLNRAHKGYRLTIREAYYRQLGHRGRPRINDIPTFTRSLIGPQRVGLHPIIEIVFSGRQVVWELVLSNGMTLRATPNHLILTVRDYLPLSELKPGNLVFCESHRPFSSGEKSPKRNYRQVQGLKFHPYAGTAQSLRRRGNWKQEGRLYRVAYHRLVAEADLNKLDISEFISICRGDEGKAKTLQFLDPNIIPVHHRDEDHLHNESDNLLPMSHAQHRLTHADYSHLNQGIPFLSEVISVRRVGVEDTYDIICEEPNHNFIADGIIVHNSGKTNILLTLAAQVRTKSLIVVHTDELFKQTIKRCQDWLGFDPGIITGGKKHKIKEITIGMVQSLQRMNIDKNHELYNQFGCVIVDECHHSPALTWTELLRRLPCRYKYGFTATAWRKDKMDFLIWRMLGPITAKVPVQDVIDAGKIVWPEILSIPTEYYFEIEEGDTSKWTAMISDLISNEERNWLIVRTIAHHLTRDPSVKALVLTDRIEHAKILTQMMKPYNPEMLMGELNTSQRAEAMLHIRAGARLTIATTHLLGEGVDVPCWDLLFLVTPIAGGPRTIQVVGRIARAAPGKDRALLVDFVDSKIPMLQAAAWSRYSLYKNKGERKRRT